jgi:hypothetical protein
MVGPLVMVHYIVVIYVNVLCVIISMVGSTFEFMSSGCVPFFAIFDLFALSGRLTDGGQTTFFLSLCFRC